MAANHGPRQPVFVNHQQNNNDTTNTNVHNEAENMAGCMHTSNPTVNFSMGNINVPGPDGLSGRMAFYIPSRQPVIQYDDTSVQVLYNMAWQFGAHRVVGGVLAVFQRRIIWWAQREVNQAGWTTCQTIVHKTLTAWGVKFLNVAPKPPLDWHKCVKPFIWAAVSFGVAYMLKRWIDAGRQQAMLAMAEYMGNGYCEIQAAEVALHPQVYAVPIELAADIQRQVFLRPRDTMAVDSALKIARKFAEQHAINPSATKALMAGATAAAMTVSREELEVINYTSGPLVHSGHVCIQNYYSKFGVRTHHMGFFGALQRALAR